MLYVSSDTQFDVADDAYDWMSGGRATEPCHQVVIKDTEDDEFVLRVYASELKAMLEEQGIMMQAVAGLFATEDWIFITPLSGVELQAFKQLTNPHFFMRDKIGEKGARSYVSYGLYNFGIVEDSWSRSPDRACSIARLLLDSCGEARDDNTGGSRMETTQDYIAVVVDDQRYQVLYLRFDIVDYQKVQRLYSKYRMLNMAGKPNDFRRISAK